MLISKITLCDFGVFRGRVDIDLTPRHGASRIRPIVLFGGLNGAGKTTLLTAIRLGFYGRLVGGAGTSQKTYEQFLLSLIHRSRSTLVPADSASVTIDFHHAQLGVRTRYSVTRSWSRKGNGVTEIVEVAKDGDLLSDLTQEQLQSLLNQLVPIGIADLFFFDGEKISELATQDRSVVLSESIKRLVGLHVVERLQNDLLTFSRQVRKDEGVDSNVELERLLEQRDKQLTTAKVIETEVADLDAEIVRTSRDLEAAETELGRLGGAWAKDRGALKAEREKLLAEVRGYETKVRSALDSDAPFALLGKQAALLGDQVRDKLESQIKDALRGELAKRVDALRSKLKGVLSAADFAQAESAIKQVFSKTLSNADRAKGASIHLSESEAAAILKVLEVTAPSSERDLQRLAETLGRQRRLLDELDQQIARMPDDSVIAAQLAAVKELEGKLINLKASRLQRVRDIKSAYWTSFEVTRSIKRLEETADSGASQSKAVALAATVHKLLGDFALALKQEKLRQLATALQHSFQRLARKTDLIAKVDFDPETFAVSIRDRNGTVISKKELSAGEQQVFAIAVLDALLTCSGRSLPLVIDTPLGRLDSKHRERLVQDYFPRAAHQVVVLSTDTEVDREFYEDLAPHLSHSYHLEFDEESGSTTVSAGYFWRDAGELKNAA